MRNSGKPHDLVTANQKWPWNGNGHFKTIINTRKACGWNRAFNEPWKIIPNYMTQHLGGFKFFLSCNYKMKELTRNNIQYCAKVMRAKFVELRCFSVLFNGIQRIFERNDMSTKYSRNIMPSIVLTQSELSGRATKSCSACSEFSNKDNEFSF